MLVAVAGVWGAGLDYWLLVSRHANVGNNRLFPTGMIDIETNSVLSTAVLFVTIMLSGD